MDTEIVSSTETAVLSGERDLLNGWVDWDVTAWGFGRLVGLFADEPNDKPGDSFRRHKGTFWSNDSTGEALYNLAGALVEGVLERRDEPDVQYRWNPLMSSPRMNPGISQPNSPV